MDISFLVMWAGFILASYSVVGNDVIQTLGTFLTSNEKRVKWYILWGFASIILILAEIMLGIILLLGCRAKITLWSLLVLSTIFLL